MEKIKISEIIKACQATLLKGEIDVDIKNLSIDSRLVKADGGFFALKGERVDGHDFIEDAIENACKLIIIEKELYSYKEGVTYIKVENTERALGDLAKYYLAKFPIKKVAITGSTGKTTTKEMLFEILKAKFSTTCNEGNLNNLIGLPLTAFKVDGSTQVAIFEMGMDRLGEIQRLGEIVSPHIGIITNVGLSHLSRLKSKDNILKAKGEIKESLGDKDYLLINGDDFAMKKWQDEKQAFTTIRIGIEASNDVLIENINDKGEEGISFDFVYQTEKEKIYLKVPGIHNAMNASLAIMASLKLGITLKEASLALADFHNTDKRLNIIKLKNFKIIDDSYNASPDSVKAAIDVLASIKGKRKMAILGDMFELGENEKAYHREMGEYASQKAIDVVVSVGENAEEISMAAKEKGINGFHFKCKDMLITVLNQWIRKGDVILVKGSRGMAMEEIVTAIQEIKIV